MVPDLEKTLEEIRAAETDDLLDRITAFRAGMEPDAIEMIEEELTARQVFSPTIEILEKHYRDHCIFDERGIAYACTRCRRPAVQEGWSWFRWHLDFKWFRSPIGFPLFPIWARWCEQHWHDKTTSELEANET